MELAIAMMFGLGAFLLLVVFAMEAAEAEERERQRRIAEIGATLNRIQRNLRK
jgi:hypothetical protein